MLLIPGTLHAITWSKQNLLDDATYYVRAVIRDVRTETILETIDLDDLGNGRFAGYWNVVQDPGFGREIEIEKTVYDDSGYTQVSGVYGRWLERYSVIALNSNSKNFGGGVTIDYKHIIDALSLKFAEHVANIKPPEPVDLSGVMVEFGAVKKSLGERIKELLNIDSKAEKLAKTEENILAAVKEFQTAVTTTKKEISSVVAEAVSTIKKAAQEETQTILDAAEARENILTVKTDKELTHVVEQFKKIMDAEADKFVKKLDAFSKVLEQPVKIDLTANRAPAEPEKKEEAGDERIKRIVTMSQ